MGWVWVWVGVCVVWAARDWRPSRLVWLVAGRSAVCERRLRPTDPGELER